MTEFESALSTPCLYITIALLALLVVVWIAGQRRERKKHNDNMKRKIIRRIV